MRPKKRQSVTIRVFRRPKTKRGLREAAALPSERQEDPDLYAPVRGKRHALRTSYDDINRDHSKMAWYTAMKRMIEKGMKPETIARKLHQKWGIPHETALEIVAGTYRRNPMKKPRHGSTFYAPAPAIHRWLQDHGDPDGAADAMERTKHGWVLRYKDVDLLFGDDGFVIGTVGGQDLLEPWSREAAREAESFAYTRIMNPRRR